MSKIPSFQAFMIALFPCPRAQICTKHPDRYQALCAVFVNDLTFNGLSKLLEQLEGSIRFPLSSFESREFDAGLVEVLSCCVQPDVIDGWRQWNIWLRFGEAWPVFANLRTKSWRGSTLAWMNEF